MIPLEAVPNEWDSEARKVVLADEVRRRCSECDGCRKGCIHGMKTSVFALGQRGSKEGSGRRQPWSSNARMVQSFGCCVVDCWERFSRTKTDQPIPNRRSTTIQVKSSFAINTIVIRKLQRELAASWPCHLPIQGTRIACVGSYRPETGRHTTSRNFNHLMRQAFRSKDRLSLRDFVALPDSSPFIQQEDKSVSCGTATVRRSSKGSLFAANPFLTARTSRTPTALRISRWETGG